MSKSDQQLKSDEGKSAKDLDLNYNNAAERNL